MQSNLAFYRKCVRNITYSFDHAHSVSPTVTGAHSWAKIVAVMGVVWTWVWCLNPVMIKIAWENKGTSHGLVCHKNVKTLSIRTGNTHEHTHTHKHTLFLLSVFSYLHFLPITRLCLSLKAACRLDADPSEAGRSVSVRVSRFWKLSRRRSGRMAD